MNNTKQYLEEVFEKHGEHEFCQIGGEEEPYIAPRGLVEAINLAIFLERPLLIKGEPGCGKTRFSKAVAYELYKEEPNYKDHFIEWHIKSTTKAKDGLYTFNYVDRLRDAQIYGQLPPERQEEVLKPEHYVEFGPLGRAFYFDKQQIAPEDMVPKVVLIDEIDKADIDFPNDLLLELDEMRFTIDEVKIKDEQGNYKRKTVNAPTTAKPIIIITSNNEKELPDAFLRRCLFYHIPFPAPQHLLSIIQAHFIKSKPEAIREAIRAFYHLRDVMNGDESSGKKVSTSELLDWFKVLEQRGDSAMMKQLENLPFSSILLKSFGDHKKYLIQKDHLNKPQQEYFPKS